MPVWPQHSTALLVEYANYRAISGDVGDTDATAIAANPGDVIHITVAANDDDVYLCTLPLVALGGPVTVKLTGVFGGGDVCTIIPTVSDTVAGCLIDGFGSITLNNVGDMVTLASDGTQWWIISKTHNTHDSF